MRFMVVTQPRRTLAVVVAVLTTALVLTLAYLQYRDRTVVLGEQRGDSRLVRVHSVPVRSADVMPDRRHVRVRYIGGTPGACGDFSSVRLTKRGGEVNVRVEVGTAPGRPPDSICTLGGVPKTLVVPLREQLPATTHIRPAS